MRCAECGATLRRTREAIVETVRGVEVSVEGIDHYVCDGCGDTVMDIAAAELLAKRQAELVAKEKGLLAPAEIKSIRKALGLTQREFEAVLGVSSPTVSRWETGAMLPSKTADSLIRVLEACPEALRFLKGCGAKASFEVDSTVPTSSASVRYENSSVSFGGTMRLVA